MPGTRLNNECIKQNFLLTPPLCDILLGETLYLGLASWTRSTPAPCNVDLGLGPGSGVLCVLQLWRYGHRSHGQWPGYGRTVLASECVCVFIFMISKLTGSQNSSGAKFSKHVGALSLEMVGVFSNVVCDGCGPGFGSLSPPLMAADQVSVDTLGNLKTGRHRTHKSTQQCPSCWNLMILLWRR